MVLEEVQQYALCLNMIVKDESHIIKDTLKKLLQKIHFDYWVISDTGSTDETIEIITEFFKEVGIPGELYQDEWVDFSHNRNKALDYAFGKSKYLLIFDADDEVCGDFVLPELVKDYYQFQFGSYTRTQIVNNNKRWKYVGVLHECIVSNDDRIDGASMEIIKGSYYTVSGRSGNRNLDSNKYLKDAIILEKAYYNAVDVKDDIYNRYCFYCANSYYDCEKYEHAISWYKKTLENGGWAQEKYVSCLKLYKCYEKMNNKESGFFYLVKSAEYDKERAECYYELIKYYSGLGLRDVAYGYYGVLRDFYRDTYLKDGLNQKLFLDESISEFYLPYYVIIVSEKMRDYDTGIHMYRIIFTKKCKIFNEWFIGNLMYNLQFFTERVEDEDKTAFYSLFQEYVDFLVANNYPLVDETMKIYEKYGIKKKEASIAIDDECLTSKKILIYTGFMDYLWNDTYVSNNSIGGAEKAVAYLARNLPKEYEIIISGDVADEVVGNVKYVNRFKLQALLDVEKFHTIIVSRYVSFFLLFPRFSCHQLYLSAHDSTGFLNNVNGVPVPVHTIIEENNKYIKGVICLTTWHKLNTIQTHACLKDKVSIINNGILVADATSNKKMSHNKIKNKFVWTSCSYRGLDVMLKLWDEILEVMPDATLDISSYDAFPNPCNKRDEENQMIINRHSDSVKHHGKLNTLQLHDLISKAEYWLYTNTFCETSCITALEMLMHEVVCLYYPLAGLTDTIGEYGIQVNSGTEIESIMNLSEAKKVEMRINGKKYAMSCSWENRAKEWASVLGLNNRCVVNAQVTSVDDDIYNINKIYDSINLMFKYGISNNTDKVVHHEYHKFYDNILQPFHKSYGGLVEIGIGNGLSLPMWMSMFENSHIYGIEKEILNTSISNDKVTILEADQSNIDDLKKIKSMLMNKNIFFINDDGSHIPEHQILTFNMLFPILVEGGIYIIEDIETSYWTKGSCYDYKTEYGYKHCKSIIEIFKDSIDIMNREFISDKKQLSNKILHHNYIESVLFARNCIIIKKTYNADREYRFRQFIEVETTSKDINAEVKINLNKKEWVFFCSIFYEKKMIQQYIDGLNNLYADAEYYIHLSSDKEAIMKSKPEKVTIVYEVFDSSIFNSLPNSNFSFLNTEPLTIPYRFDNIKLIFELYKKHMDSFNYYDYSESNLRLLNDKCIGVGVDKVYLPYKCSSEELLILQSLNKNTKKEYDFGILKTLGKEVSPRRKKIVDFLKYHNFSVNIIEGWNYNDRDFELAKCKIILNIHGNLNNDVSTIFEHIRCDRLLEAGFNILSETSYDLCPDFVEKYPNIRFIEYENFFDIGIIVDCYNNSFVGKEHNKYVLEILNNCHNKLDIPLVHISFIEKLSLEFNPKKMVIYDIGSSVLHWTQHANVLWKDSAIYLFDAMTEMKLFYHEYNKTKNTTFEYNVGVLCDEDYKRISFYQNNELSGGNSYYKEIGHPDSHKIFTENHIKHKLGMKLETVVKNKKIPLPDLIKIDVQGAELDILKGSMKIINNAKFLIVELQHVEYNQGAPLCNKTRDFLIENGWEVYAEKFSNNGPDADWCFINKNRCIVNPIVNPNLKLTEYENLINVDVTENIDNNILNKKWYCFIHSCHLKEKGLNRLDYLITSLKSNDLFSKFETIYINNIGLPIEENRYGHTVEICNYSDNPALYEIPTINKIQHFSQTNANCNILYLHTKGVRSGDDQKVNDWTDMMLFFLVKKYELCISKLNSGIQAVGCNYNLNSTTYIYHAPKHFSGNFWWTNTNYTKILPQLIEKTENVVSYDAEFWLCQNNPTICDLHNSNINHYCELYPSTMYDDKKMITNLTCITCNEMCEICDMFQINDTLTGIDNITFYYGVDDGYMDITNMVFEKCITNHKIVIPSGDDCRAFIFGDPMFGIVKYIYMIVNNCKYCKITYDYYTCIDMVNKRCQIDITNKCINTHNIVLKKLYNHYSSAWLGHIHFACWLVRLLNPCVVVDLGVDFGHSTFAFAAAKLGCVYGVDSFEGDIQAGIKNTYNIVHDFKRELIQDNLLIDNIHFIRGYFDDVYNTFDKTIDVLHIDGLHTLDAVTNDYNTWITKTSDNAVILFHDVVSYPDTVGKLFNSIQYPKFYFTHSAGLGVVCKNSHTLNKILTSTDIPNKEFIVHDKNNKMIVDCFIFYNELDMLTYRLNILDKVVDYFVLVESTHTHVGKEKPLFYNENKHLFEKFNHKIIHIVVDDFPHKYPNINIENQEQWINERFQRDCISRGIDKLNLTGEDIITITDLDEIPNPNILTQIKNNIIVVGINIIEMDLYYYNLNSKMGIKWYASKILTFEKYKELNTGCDKIRFYPSPIIENAGWHLSYFGNEKFIKNKLENFTHQEFNMTEFTDEKRIEERIKNGNDLFDRHIKIEIIPVEDNNNLPPDYDIYLKNYYNICYEDEKVEVKLNLNKKEMDLNKFNNGSGIFIQIGAGAGDLDERANCRDGFTELVKKLPRQSIKKIILVEPNPLNIPLLKECWKDYPESIIYEIGIVPKNYQDNTIDLYYCPLDAPHYQVASINKSHVQKHYGDNCEIEKFIVPVKQLETFINEITTEEIDLLALDIEGIDAEILLDIDFNNLKLKYLSFEHLHLGGYKENVLNHLKNNNYEFVGSGVDHNGYDYLYINGHYL